MKLQAVRCNVPWRPVLLDETGQRLCPRPTAPGPQTAIVVGPDGSTQAQGAQEQYTDALSRIKVQFHLQAAAYSPQRANTAHSCWLRVAGAGMGQVHLPRIGQEVLVGFLGQDIDRPVVVGSLYNGRGESGVPRTPGGEPASPERSALADPAQLAAKGTLELKTANGVVNIAAAKKVVQAVTGGASITIDGGSFTAQCPGKITLKAGKKSMAGGGSMGHAFSNFEPVGFDVVHNLRFAPARSDAIAEDLGWVGKAFSIKDEVGKILASGVVGPDGRLPRAETSGAEKLTWTIGSSRKQVTEIVKSSDGDESLDELHTSDGHDPYLEKLAASDPVEGDFLAPDILAKIMGRPGAVDE